MPKLTFEKDLTQDEYDLLQVALKLGKTSQDEFIWAAIQGSILSELEGAVESPLANDGGMKEYRQP
jgi:hypothetical protein